MSGFIGLLQTERPHIRSPFQGSSLNDVRHDVRRDVRRDVRVEFRDQR